MIRVFCGKVRKGMRIKFMASNAEHEALEVGYMKIKMTELDELSSGEVGYVVSGVKDIHDIKIGDTITESMNPTKHYHKGYKEINPFVFAGLYPTSASEYDSLKIALEKLRLSDSSLVFSQEVYVSLLYLHHSTLQEHLYVLLR